MSTITAAGLTNRDKPLAPGTANTSVLALGLSEAVPANPSEGVPAFGALDNVPLEIDGIIKQSATGNIQGIYPGTERLNAAFDENALLDIRGHQILHIATHGHFDSTALELSYLVLGTKRPWRISQIKSDRQLFANISLVVLSACETALGVNADGREVSSIAQTFIDAGANTVVASLWQVDDSATAELMQDFYTNLATEDPVTVAKALQEAQVDMLQRGQGDRSDRRSATITVEPIPGGRSSSTYRHAHPCYWAPFVLIGNGR